MAVPHLLVAQLACGTCAGGMKILTPVGMVACRVARIHELPCPGLEVEGVVERALEPSPTWQFLNPAKPRM